MHEHAAYQIVDEVFLSFIKNNRSWINEMAVGDIMDVARRWEDPKTKVSVCSTDLLECPWSIRYVGIAKGGEGDFIVFLTENMNKIYSYYDVM